MEQSLEEHCSLKREALGYRTYLSRTPRGEFCHECRLDPLGGRNLLQVHVARPHCWNAFRPEQSLWVAEHFDLIGDPRVGEEYSRTAEVLRPQE